MSYLRQILVLAVSLSAVGACSSAVAPPDPSTVTVTVRAASVNAVVTTAGSATWVRFTLPIRVENTGATLIKFSPCASYLESRAGETWGSAWSPVCASVPDSRNEIAPGASLDAEITVAAALAGPGSPQWDSLSLDVPLRYQAGYLAAGVSGRIPTVASNEFTLTSAR